MIKFTSPLKKLVDLCFQTTYEELRKNKLQSRWKEEKVT